VPVEVVVKIPSFVFNHLFKPFVVALLVKVAFDKLVAVWTDE
jgi:hypothetical protein